MVMGLNMDQLKIARDPSSIPTFATTLTEESYTIDLAASTEAILPVPVGARFAIVKAELPFIVAPTNIVFPGGTFLLSQGAVNKNEITLNGETNLHFISRNANFLSVSFYS